MRLLLAMFLTITTVLVAQLADAIVAVANPSAQALLPTRRN